MKLEPNELIVFTYGKKKETGWMNPVDIIQSIKPDWSRSYIKDLIAQGSVKINFVIRSSDEKSNAN